MLLFVKHKTNRLSFVLRLQVQHRVVRIKHHHQVTRDEARHLLKAQVEQKEFHRTSATLSEQMEAQQQLKCRQMQCSWVVEQLTYRLFHVQVN